MRKWSSFVAILVMSCMVLSGCGHETFYRDPDSPAASHVPPATADTSGMDFTFSDKDLSGEYSETQSTPVTSLTSADKITKAGTYVFTGEIKDTMITVAAGDQDKVYLVLDNAQISNSKGPAIYIQSADKVFITLKDGTENTISDGNAYTVTDGDSTLDGAIFSKADLTINGNGTLRLNGNNKHGIVSKDDLVVTMGVLDVTAKNVALNGKDCVKMSGASCTIIAGSDGIRSDNDTDATRGYVYIEDCNLKITAGNNGIQAETVLKLEGNNQIEVKTGGGSSASLRYSTESYKGFKAGSDVLISGGTYKIDAQDDCIHSNNTVSISGGTFTLASGDDGIHGDTDLSVSGGKISISKSYEGLEASRLLISGGTIDLIASDDGLNAAGGNDSSGMGGRPGQGGFSASSGSIIISGGYTLVNASGDGIDSNGTIEVSGGVTLVSGPTNSGNGAFDYDGTATVTGGVLIALGSSGMAQGFSSAENQGAIYVAFTAQSGNTSFALCDSAGKVVASFTPAKAYQSVAITAPGIQSGESYTIVVGGTVSGCNENGYAQNTTLSGGTTLGSLTMSSNLYGSSGGMGGPGSMGGGPGGRPGRPGW